MSLRRILSNDPVGAVVGDVVVVTEEKPFNFLRTKNHELPYEMMPGFRFNSNVLYSPEEKQFYIRNSSSSKVGIGYTCYVNECTARVHVRDMKCYVADTKPHDHQNKSDMYINLSALNEMKRMLRSFYNRMTPKQVFDDVISR